VSVLVIGGGITGLAAAWELASSAPVGTRILVLEADKRLGGKILTGEVGGRAVELGPDAFLARREEALGLCRELGLGPELVSPGSDRAYVWVGGRLRQLPARLALGVPTDLSTLARSGICSPTGLARVTADLVVPALVHGSRSEGDGEVDRSVGSIVTRRLGREVHDRLVDPLVGGIHAGPIDEMSAAAVFPQLALADSRKGSLMRALRAPGGRTTPGAPREPVFMTVRGGLGRMVERLGEVLSEKGVEIRLDAAAHSLTAVARGSDALGDTAIDRPGERRPPRWSVATGAGDLQADGVVVALPGGPAARLFRSFDSSVSRLLDDIPYASVALVTLRFTRDATGSRLDGTGFLVPVVEGGLLTACTWITSKWPELARADDIVLRASMGRHGDDRCSGMTDEALIENTLHELRQMLGLRGRPLEAVVTRWPESFPQYLVGHVQRVESLENGVARHQGLALAGAALHGVGIPACIGSGRRASRRLVEDLTSSNRAAR